MCLPLPKPVLLFTSALPPPLASHQNSYRCNPYMDLGSHNIKPPRQDSVFSTLPGQAKMQALSLLLLISGTLAAGNDVYGDLSNRNAGTTLHWGPYWPLNFYEKTMVEYFHIWRVDWTSTEIKAYLDDELKITIDPVTNFWDFAGLDNSIDNPWISGGKMSPFDQKRKELFSCLVSC
ncbi:hypothetical protein O3P69_007285 [Scylla paramamosain]|uniref:GH16 domain-containing protein n=1 Tax=Scylla paramamosain TaxID=85552 RepID=A0AAW0V2H9_SCYPA